MKVVAGAGCAKTATLMLVARENKNRKMAFLAYNAAAAEDARQRFPENIQVTTIHSFAMRETKFLWQPKIGRRILPDEAAKAAGLGTDPRLGRMALETVQRFCLSTASQIGIEHVGDHEDPSLVEAARRLWARMSDPNDVFPATHDTYLKMWAIHAEKPDFDQLLLDEAQDAWPAVSDAIIRTGVPTIYVGDPYQQIYSFRGAVDALSAIKAPSLPLTQSWRFGQGIADLANGILALRPHMGLEKPIFRLRGNPGRDTHFEPHAEADPVPMLDRGSFAVICRTNAGILQVALRTPKSAPIHIVGGGSAVYEQMLDAFRLWSSQRPVTTEFKRFKNWEHFQHAAELDFNLKMALRFVEEYKTRLPDVIKALQERTVDAERQAEIVFSTIHRAKGREWDEVVIGDDIVTPANIYRRIAVSLRTGRAPDHARAAEELNLGYVAATRAKHLLRLPMGLTPKTALKEIRALEAEEQQKAQQTAAAPTFRRLTVGRDDSVMTRRGW